MTKDSELSSELIKIHLAEYQKVQDFILQLRDQQNKLTNYGVVALGALIAAAISLIVRESIPIEAFLILDIGAFFLFLTFALQGLYIDRTMLRLDDYLISYLKPAIRECLILHNETGQVAIRKILAYEEYFFRVLEDADEKSFAGNVRIDGLFALTRYAVPALGLVLSFIFEALLPAYSAPLFQNLGIPRFITLLAVSIALFLVWFLGVVLVGLSAQQLRHKARLTNT